MIDEPSINSWLDLWEDWEAEQGSSPDERAFVAKHCGNAPPEMVEEFRRKLRRLQRMDARVDAAAASDTVTGAASGDTQSPSEKPTTKLLQPGLEPVKGYVLLQKLGQGGFGQVWKATGPGGQEVAMKFVRLEKRVEATEQRALEVMKHVRHPHLLSCHGSWQVGKWLVVAMDLADKTLLDRFNQVTATKELPGIPREELLGYMEEAAKGIDYLNEPNHANADGVLIGIQHRDIKPQNLLLQGGGLKVADFGLAKFVEHSVTGHTGAMTLSYSAPESFENKTASQSDQYSLAVTYCQLRGGRLPFVGSPVEVMFGHRNREPDLSMLPKSEQRAVARALAKAPKDRWPNCRAFVAALRAAAEGRSVATTWGPFWADRRIISGVAVVIFLVISLPILFLVTRGGSDRSDSASEAVPASTGLVGAPVVAADSSPAVSGTSATIAEESTGQVDPAVPVAEMTAEAKASEPTEEPLAKTSADAETVASPAPTVSAASTKVSPQAEASAAPRSDFVSLFNGRDLSGWEQFRTVEIAPGNPPRVRHMPTSGAWTVSGGEVVCVSGLDQQGFLRTTRQYSDFVLRLEFRIAAGGNTGVLFRCPDGDVNGSTAGIEAQIIDDYAPERKMPPGIGQTGSIWGVATGKVPRSLRSGGEWNAMEIRCEGDRVQITVNGTPTTDVRMSENLALKHRPRSGYIALNAEGKTATGPWFRSIEIHDLTNRERTTGSSGSTAPSERALEYTHLFDGTDLSGWQQFRATIHPNRRLPDGKAVFAYAPTRGAWAARNGELVCVSRGENAQGYIRTTRSFSDFVLTFDFRVPPGCNSKLYLRMQDVTAARMDEECIASKSLTTSDGRELTSPNAALEPSIAWRGRHGHSCDRTEPGTACRFAVKAN